MTQDIFDGLNKYESYLITASKADYIRSLTNKQMDELISLGDSLGIIYKNNHCPKCALEFVKKLATPYFEEKQKMEELKNEGEVTAHPKRGSKKTSSDRGDSKG